MNSRSQRVAKVPVLIRQESHAGQRPVGGRDASCVGWTAIPDASLSLHQGQKDLSRPIGDPLARRLIDQWRVLVRRFSTGSGCYSLALGERSRDSCHTIRGRADAGNGPLAHSLAFDREARSRSLSGTSSLCSYRTVVDDEDRKYQGRYRYLANS